MIKYSSLISIVSIVGMMILAVVDVITSKFFNFPIPSASEFIEDVNVLVVCMTIGYVQLERGHMGVNVFERRLGEGMNHILQLAGYILGMMVCALVSWRALILTQSMIESMTTKSGMVNFPIWPFPLAIALGHGLLVIAFVQVFIRGIATGPKR